MFAFFGKIVLLIALAFGLGTLAGRRRRPTRSAASPGPQRHNTQSGLNTAPAASAAPVAHATPGTELPRNIREAGSRRQPSEPVDTGDRLGETAGSSAPDVARRPPVSTDREAGNGSTTGQPTPAGVEDAETAGGEAFAASARLAATPHEPKPLPDDPLTEKFRAEPFRKNFRSVDYKRLSLDPSEIEAERTRRRQHSSWNAPEPSRAKAEPMPEGRGADEGEAFSGRFASFGGATVMADVILGGEAGAAPSMTPTLPGEDPDSPSVPAAPSDGVHPGRPARPEPARLGGPHPDMRTPDAKARAAGTPDPLAEKHKSESFDRDWRTLNYGQLGDGAEPAAKAKMHDWTPKPEATGEAEPTGYPAAFSALGVAAALPGAPAQDHSDALPIGASKPSGRAVTPLGAPGAHEGAMGLEPRRLDAPHDGKPDALTRIKGIGPTIERLLLEHGIYHFDQIAGWSTAEAQWIEQMIGFAGRVEREDWIGQAKALAENSEG